MSYRYDTQHLAPQQKAIIAHQDRENKRIREASEKHSVQKETDYCKVFKRVTVPMSTGGYAGIELIEVKEHGTMEVRLGYFKEKDGEIRIVGNRPLDLKEDELKELLKKAKEEKLITF